VTHGSFYGNLLIYCFDPFSVIDLLYYVPRKLHILV